VSAVRDEFLQVGHRAHVHHRGFTAIEADDEYVLEPVRRVRNKSDKHDCHRKPTFWGKNGHKIPANIYQNRTRDKR
jgi:hypothetical protein